MKVVFCVLTYGRSAFVSAIGRLYTTSMHTTIGQIKADLWLVWAWRTASGGWFIGASWSSQIRSTCQPGKADPAECEAPAETKGVPAWRTTELAADHQASVAAAWRDACGAVCKRRDGCSDDVPARRHIALLCHGWQSQLFQILIVRFCGFSNALFDVAQSSMNSG